MATEQRWREVTKDEFYWIIGPLNVHPQVQENPWPYTCLFKGVEGRIHGKTLCESVPNPARYWLPVI